MSISSYCEQWVRPLGLWCFGLVCLFSVGPTQFQLSEISAVLVLSVWVADWRQFGAMVKQLALPLLLFVAVMLIGYLGSVFPQKSIKGVWELFRSLFVLIAGASLLVHQSQDRIVDALVRASWVAAALLAGLYLWAVSQWHWSWSLRNNGALSSVISGIHEFANVAAMAGLVVVSAIIYLPRYRTLPMFGLALLLAYLLLASDSLGAYLALFYCLLLLFVWWKSAFAPAFAVLSLALVVVMVWVSFFTDGHSVAGYELPNSFVERIQLYQGTWQAYLDRLWFGYGLNSFKFAPELIGGGLNQVMPHNVFLQLLFCVGTLGSLLFCLGLFALIRALKVRSGWADFSLLNRLGVLFLVYLAFRGLTELHLSFKFYVALLLSLVLLTHLNGWVDRRRDGVNP